MKDRMPYRRDRGARGYLNAVRRRPHDGRQLGWEILEQRRLLAYSAGLDDVTGHVLAAQDVGNAVVAPSVSDAFRAALKLTGGLHGPADFADGEMVLLATGPSPAELQIRTSHNANAADTTNTDQVHQGGGLGLNLTGAGYVVGIWDGGLVRPTHQEFGGRVTTVDTASPYGVSFHATHVAGTIGAAGVSPAAKGMATGVEIRSRDWDNDLVEMIADSALLDVSNHSYGYLAGWEVFSAADVGISTPTGLIDVWLEDRYLYSEATDFGKYSTDASVLDQVLFDSPNLLSVWSAGNDRSDAFTNASSANNYVTYLSGNPGGGWSGPGWYLVPNSGGTSVPGGDGNGGTGFDSLGLQQNAKNSLVVGAVNDVTADPYTSGEIVTTSFSSYGPTDDGRIKPDVVGNGASVFSTLETSDTAYGSFSGTSMSSPNVAGTAVLLVEHFEDEFGFAPTAATSKGVLVHTASDAGNAGPDYAIGWGLVNAAGAATFITDAADGSDYLEERIYNGSEWTLNVEGGGEPLKATIVWTDPEGAAHGAGQDVSAPALVNDLDLWITGPGGTYFPWSLDRINPSAPATRTAANHVDNVEQVLIDAPAAGTYTVHVGRTGASFTQPFTVLISGRTNGSQIEGVKWNDLDGDGVHDAGEPGLAGWVVYADVNGDGDRDAGEPFATTAGNGAYTLEVDPGTYAIREEQQPGWSQTSPRPRLFAVRGSNNTVPAIYELDATGSVLNSFPAPATTPTIGPQGLATGPKSLFYIDGAGTGVHTLYELDLNTGAVIDSDVLPLSAEIAGLAYLNGRVHLEEHPADKIIVFDPITDTVVTTLMVGNVDLVGGLTGAPDLGLLFDSNVAGQIFAINPNTGAVQYTLTTGAGLLNGGLAYFNGELLAAGFSPTPTIFRIHPATGAVLGTITPGGVGSLSGLGSDSQDWYTVTVANGAMVGGINFGNQSSSSAADGDIRGMKWNDLNGNGARDPGEPGLPNWEVFIDSNSDGDWDPGEPKTTTDAGGFYSFTDLAPGTYVVAEVQQSGWQQTFPIPAGGVQAVQTPEAVPEWKEAAIRAGDLTAYSDAELASATAWIVGFKPGAGQAKGRLGGSWAEVPLVPNTYQWSLPAGLSPQDAPKQLEALGGVDFSYPLTPRQQSKRLPNDPLFNNQWHLRNTGQSGGTALQDVNVEPAWNAGWTGAGVVIGIVDDGLEYTHPDLSANYTAALSWDFNGNDADPAPGTFDDHGTAVAGVASARGNNALGVTGASQRASLAGLRLIAGPSTDAMEATALSFMKNEIDIYSNSWGPFDDADRLEGPGPLTLIALADAVATGRDGKGNIFVWAGGNGKENFDNVNYDGYASSRYTIAVAAVDHNGVQSYYSEPGASLLVAAPSSGDVVGITTTDRVSSNGYDPSDYTSLFGGTSSAAPLVSGVIALMLEANPNLSWRDVQHILVTTARKNHPGDSGWTNNGAGLHVNHKYGFGVIDAGAAVAAAANWTLAGPEVSTTSGQIAVNQPIPDNNTTGVSSTFSIPAGQVDRIESVEVVFNAAHPYRGDLEVVLTSPSGVQSILAEVHGDDGNNYSNWTFTSTRHWGEDAAGIWTLTVRDRASADLGTFQNWKLNIYGTSDSESVGTDRLYALPRDGSNDIVELDPNTGAEVNRFDAPEPVTISGPDGLAFDGQTLFYLNGETGKLWELNPDTGAPLDFTTLATNSFDGLAALGGFVYILDHINDDILKFDPVADSVTATVSVNADLIGGLTAIQAPDRLVATSSFGLSVVEIDPATGAITDSFTPTGPGQGDYLGVAVIAGQLYLGRADVPGFDVYSRDGVFRASQTTPHTISALGGDDVSASRATPAAGKWTVVLNAGGVAANTNFGNISTAGITVTPTSGLTTTEAGATANFTIVLNSQPTADVTIALSSSDTTEGTVSPASVTFTSANWNTAQQVTITGVNDFLDDGNIAYTIVTAPAVSTDANYSGRNAADVFVTNTDNDTAGITVTPTSGLNTTEAGGAATFTIVLNSQPTANVTIGLSSSDTTEGTVSPASVTFTTANWSAAQEITVTGVDDFLDDGAIAYTISTAAASSSDAGYNGTNPADVSVSNADNDTAGITVTPTSSLTTTEAGGAATFTIVLNSQPTANVTIGLSSSDLTEGTVSPASVTFTSANWDVAQEVTVTGVDDFLDDGNVAYTVNTAAAVSSDANYNGANPPNVSVTNTDNDAAGITVTPTSDLITTEAGGTATFTVVLDSQPIANVTIGLSSSDLTEGTVSPASLVFTSANWNVARDVTVSGVNDFLDDSDIAYTITTAAATSSDANYNGMNAADVSVTNTDNDTSGITVSPTSGLITTEAGDTAAFTVVLDSQPTADVTIELASTDLTEGTVSPAGVTFTAANWNVAQEITITGVDDALIDGDINYSITLLASSSDANYDGLDDVTASVTNENDDVPGITVAPTSGHTTTEAGGTATFTLVLDTQPAANVTIDLSSNDLTEGTISPASVTFTAANWSVAQQITVTGVNDFVDDGNIAYTINTAAATSSDPNYSGLNAADVSATNTDNDAAGIAVSPTSGLTTTEAGGTATFTIVLNSQPAADVTIELSSADMSEGAVSPASVTFTAVNWSVAQEITVAGVDDFVDDGNIAYTITTAAATSSDPNYSGLNAVDVSATNADNDAAGITVSPTSGLTTTEAGGTATFTIVLNSQPTADVTIDLSSGDPTEGAISPASVTFTAVNWSVAQEITVAGVDDFVDDGNIAYTITTAAATSSDAGYNGLNAVDVAATNTDDDQAGVTVTPTSNLDTTEAGGTATFTLVLNSQPTADVTIGLSSSDVGEGTVAPASVTFTAANWNVAQEIALSGADDFLDDGDIAYSITTAAATSSDPNYSGRNAADVSVINFDNDTAGITVSPTSGLTTTEGGATATFTIVLDSQPTADVTIGLSSSDPSEGAASTGSVTFTPGNWNIAQEITITGMDDFLDDGDLVYTITTAAAVSSDVNYAGRNAPDVSVTNTDDDAAGIIISPTTALTTTEAGGTAAFTVVLNSQPTAIVTIGLSSSDATEGAVSPASVTFTPANWNVAQVITVTGADDSVDDGDVAYTITTAAAVSSDASYNGSNAVDVSGANTDDDTAAFTIVESGSVTAVSENGAGDTFSVVLAAQPLANVVLALTVGDATETSVSPATLTFTPANWNVAQTATVTPVDDLLLDGAQTTVITVAVDEASSDPPFAGLADQTVSVTTADDDALGETDLLPAAVAENIDASAADVLVGMLSTGELDAGNELVYSLVSGAGDEDNSLLVVNGNQLLVKMGSAIDFEAQASLNVRVRVSHGSETFDTMLVVSVVDVNESPADIALANSSVSENDTGATVGAVTVIDPDAGDAHTLTVSDDRFEIVTGMLKLKEGVSLDFETQSSVNLEISATDSGGLNRTEEFVVTVTDVFEAPPHPWRNSRLRWDVDDNGSVQINDLLLLVRALREDGINHPLPLSYVPPDGPPPYLDVDGDDRCSLNDLLEVVRYLRENPIAPLSGEPEEDELLEAVALDVAHARAGQL